MAKKQRGGKRKGAGAKRKPYRTKVLSVRVRESWYDECEKLIKGKVAELKSLTDKQDGSKKLTIIIKNRVV